MNYSELSIRELKSLLIDRGIDFRSALYRDDLVALLDNPIAPRISMSVSALRALIRHSAGRPGTCSEKIDLFHLAKQLLKDRKCLICLEPLLSTVSESVVPFSCCDLVVHQPCCSQWLLSSQVVDPKCLNCLNRVESNFITTILNAQDYDKYTKIMNGIRNMSNPNSEGTEFDDQMLKQGFKKCPKCKVWIEKGPSMEMFGMVVAPGCDKMTCRCGAKFCFKCASINAECHCTSDEHGFFSQQDVLQEYPGASISSPAQFLGNLFKY